MRFPLWTYGTVLTALLLVPQGVCAQDGPRRIPEAADEINSPEYWRDYRVGLEYHPIGAVVPKGRLRISGYTPMQPAGFRASDLELRLNPTYGLGHGWEVTAGTTVAERLGRGGRAFFYGAGVQKQLAKETRTRPSLSLGGYGMIGVRNHKSGSVYAAASKRVLGGNAASYAVFLHGGAKFEGYDGDDYGSGTGLRPYLGATLTLHRRFAINAELSPSQPWQRDDMFAVRGTYLVYRSIGITGGIRNAGYNTTSFVGLVF